MQQQRLKPSASSTSAGAAHCGAAAEGDMNCGLHFLHEGEYNRAIGRFERSAGRLHEKGNVHGQRGAHLGIGDAFVKLGQYNRAIIMFDRCRQLAVESNDVAGEANAFERTGKCYMLQNLYRLAATNFERSLSLFEALRDAYGEARVCHGLCDAYSGLHIPQKAQYYSDRADAITQESANKVSSAYKALDRIEQVIVNATSLKSTRIALEMVAAKVPRLRDSIETCTLEIQKHRQKRKVLTNVLDGAVRTLKCMQHDYREALASTSLHMDSKWIHGVQQRVPIQELRTKLRVLIADRETFIEEATKEGKRVEILIRNAQDDLSGLKEELECEFGELMLRVQRKRLVRCFALNITNVQRNNVLGSAPDGTQRCISAMNSSIFIYDMNDGSAVHAIVGDREGRHIGEPVAHTKAVTALFYSGDCIYSGSADRTARVWNASNYVCTLILEGHTGTVWSIIADTDNIFTGSSDTTVRIWCSGSGECLRVLQAHNRTVKCMDIAANALLTGSADFDIKVWSFKEDSKDKQKRDFGGIRCDQRLVGQDCAVTALSFSSTDVVSGGEDGCIVVWDGSTGDMLKKFVAHRGSVLCIQFDSAIVISGGVGGSVLMQDIVTGDTITTFRDHKKNVLALQFDNEKILSSDGSEIVVNYIRG